MNKNFLILLFAILANSQLFCQVSFSNYTALSLPENLKKDANAAYRIDEGILEIASPSKYTFTTRQVITLLNKDAAQHLHQRLHYDKFQKIENIVFKIYNVTGDLLRTYQKKDFNTRD